MRAVLAFLSAVGFACCTLGCGAGYIRKADGTFVVGGVFGSATLELCEGEGHIAPSTIDKAGSLNGPCDKIGGGDIGAGAKAVIQGLIDGVISYFTGPVAVASAPAP